MELTSNLFTEIFRPKTLDGLILPQRIRQELSKGLIQNLMLYGPAGSGKSSIARILINGYDTLYLNGSSENGIDIIREKVVSFASAMSLDNGAEKLKVIYIDEADGLTVQAWDALRETIERFASSVRYICTCNKIDKIPAPIKSRFNCIPVYPITKEEEAQVFEWYCMYVKKILDHFNINTADDTLKAFVRNYFPDMRSILNTIQTLQIQGASELNAESLVKSFDCSDLFELLVNGKDPVENYKFIMTNYSSSPADAILEISKSFIDFLLLNHSELAGKVPYLVIAIAEYVNMVNTSPDQIVTLLACCYKVQTILSN